MDGHNISLGRQKSRVNVQQKVRVRESGLGAIDIHGPETAFGLPAPASAASSSCPFLQKKHALFLSGRGVTADEVEKKTEEESAAKNAAKLRKQLGIPEMDPDPLPSTQTQKMLNLHALML